MRYKKQNWMQGRHNGKMVDFFNWPKFGLTKSVFFRARAVNRGTHVYPRMSKGYLQPLVFFIFGVTFVHANLCQLANFYNYSKKELQRKTIYFSQFPAGVELATSEFADQCLIHWTTAAQP